MYFGSVRFFKNLILLAVCVLILTPSLLAVKFYRQIERSAGEPAPPEMKADDAPEFNSPNAVFEPDSSFADRFGPMPGSAQDGVPLAADPPDYQSLYPDFYAPQPYAATEREENVIYLTFDDGPSDRTDEILAVLAEKDVKATFFVTGKSNQKDIERMRRIVEEGHTIGMHSYSHVYATIYSSVESFLGDFYSNFLQIREVTGQSPTVFRFPGGSINGYDGGFYKEIISEMIRRGFVPFDWNISSEDAVTTHIQSTSVLTANVVRGAQGKVRGVVLFHDSTEKTTTPRALASTIDQLRAMGFEFAAISPSTLPVLYNYEYQ